MAISGSIPARAREPGLARAPGPARGAGAGAGVVPESPPQVARRSSAEQQRDSHPRCFESSWRVLLWAAESGGFPQRFHRRRNVPYRVAGSEGPACGARRSPPRHRTYSSLRVALSTCTRRRAPRGTAPRRGTAIGSRGSVSPVFSANSVTLGSAGVKGDHVRPLISVDPGGRPRPVAQTLLKPMNQSELGCDLPAHRSGTDAQGSVSTEGSGLRKIPSS